MNEPREMDAEKWKFCVGHRVNQVANKKLPLLFDLKILAAEWNDFRRWFLSRRLHKPVGMQSATSDDKFCAKIPGGRFDDLFAAVRNNFQNARVEPDIVDG